MFKTSDHLLYFLANRHRDHEASSSNGFDASYGTLKAPVWHSLSLSGINVNHDSVTYIVNAKECPQRRMGFGSENGASLPPIASGLRHLTIQRFHTLLNTALNASLRIDCSPAKR